jgi:hypothetical protein
VSQIDPCGQYFIIAADRSVAEVQRLLPYGRVMPAWQFEREHPPDAQNVVPATVFVQVPELEGDTVHVYMEVPGVSTPTPPNVLACGYGYNFILARDGQGWRIVKHWQTAC